MEGKILRKVSATGKFPQGMSPRSGDDQPGRLLKGPTLGGGAREPAR